MIRSHPHGLPQVARPRFPVLPDIPEPGAHDLAIRASSHHDRPGRGAAAAFAGACRACRLSDAIIGHATTAEAFAAYEAAMRPVVEDIMPATRAAVKWHVPMTRRTHAIRNGLVWFVPNVAAGAKRMRGATR